MTNDIKYSPLGEAEPLASLTQCSLCGAVVTAGTYGQGIHTKWHADMGQRVMATIDRYSAMRAQYQGSM